MTYKFTIKAVVAAVVMTVVTTTAACSVKAVFSGGYMDPLVEAVGVLTHTKLAVPVARLIQHRTLPESSK